MSIEQQPVDVAGAVGQPVDAGAVGAGGASALVEFVVLVVPDRGASVGVIKIKVSYSTSNNIFLLTNSSFRK